MLVYCSSVKRKLETHYPVGTRVRCLDMLDDPHPIPPGTEGTVTDTNGFGQISVHWDTGSTLKLLHEIDRFELV